MPYRRRELLELSGGLLAGCAIIPAALHARTKGVMAMNDYFLSAGNPTATRDQQALDKLAIEILARADVQTAVARTRGGFARVTDKTWSAGAMALLPAYTASYAFRSILMAVNADVNYPKVLRVYSPAQRWLGNDVPESRWGSENPDNYYRIMPVSADGRYVVRGMRSATPASNTSFMLVADTNTSVALGLREQQDMTVEADGSFELTLDSTPANGRRNHIQLPPDSLYLFVRDSMSDWRQVPNRLRIERLNPPTRGPMSIDEIAYRAQQVMQLGLAQAYYWMQLVLNARPGELHAPVSTGPSGGLATQLSTSGWLDLGEDDAFIITVDPLDAAYHSIVLYDLWGRTLEYRDHFTSLNGTQMAADRDSRFTFVISRSDPEVHNWLDTLGLQQLTLGVRWQGINPGGQPPQIAARQVARAELAGALPAGVAQVGAADRASMLRDRQESFDLRFSDS